MLKLVLLGTKVSFLKNKIKLLKTRIRKWAHLNKIVLKDKKKKLLASLLEVVRLLRVFHATHIFLLKGVLL